MIFEDCMCGSGGLIDSCSDLSVFTRCHSGCLVTRELWARSIMRHLTTAWGKRQLSRAGLVYTDVCLMC